jgi:hypothetical protein
MAPANSKGFASGTKVVVMKEGANYASVAHEIAHTIPAPPIWTDDPDSTPPRMAMVDECKHPTFHNVLEKWAHGEQFVRASVVADRVHRDTYMIMGPARAANGRGDVDIWINQCTYWHLLKNLQRAPDPPVTLVRGYLYERGSAAKVLLLPSYSLASAADLMAGGPGRWSIVQRDADRRLLGIYPFEPDFLITESTVRRNLIAFEYRVPAIEGIAELDVVGPEGALAVAHVSRVAPSVTITSPSDRGAVVPSNGKVQIRWSGRGEAGHALLYSVLYRIKGAPMFSQQSLEQNQTSFDVSVDPSASEHEAKVVVTDGTRSAETVVHFRTLAGR